MSLPRWVSALLRRLAPPGGAEDVLGDLEEAHRNRLERRGRVVANTLTALEALDMALALVREWVRRRSPAGRAPGSRLRLVGRRGNGPSISWLDFKLGFRMLTKYPGLTMIGVLAIAVGIGIGTAFFDFVREFSDPELPLDEGDRVVGVVNWDVETRSSELRSLRDFERWRDQVASIEDMGAYNTAARNLVAEEGVVEPLKVAEISASAFRVARVPALLGRPLVEADEEPGADPVVVIGHDVWQRRFGSDTDIIGRTIRLDSTVTTVVGVMPRGFGFPVNHSSWVPLRVDFGAYEPRQGPSIRVFGRLAPGASFEEAQAELAAVGARAAADHPATHGSLRPRFVPYTEMFSSSEFENTLAVYGVNSAFVLLLLVAGLNVATLMFARATAREDEFAVRTALGAGRGRIVLQLFIEALMLVVVAAAVGLAAATLGLRWVMSLPWLPGETAVSGIRKVVAYGFASPGFPIEEYASVRLEADRQTAAPPGDKSATGLRSGFAAYQRALERRLRDEVGATAVTFGTRPPGTSHPTVTIEVADANEMVGPLRQRVRTASVDIDFFDALRVPIVAGRPFHTGDLGSDHAVVIVNEPFVREVLEDTNPIGRRVREIVDGSASGPWKEIVGVVRDLGMNPIDTSRAAGFYSPLAPGEASGVHMIVHASGRRDLAMQRIPSISHEVDPTVRLYGLDRLEAAGKSDKLAFRALIGVIATFSATALLLSSAGTHALMSFVVTRRRREIGICLALGARRRSVLGMVFSRALLQLGAGVLVGGVVGGLAMNLDSARASTGLLVSTLVVLLAVGLLASAVPVLRALRIQPSEVLRDG